MQRACQGSSESEVQVGETFLEEMMPQLLVKDSEDIVMKTGSMEERALEMEAMACVKTEEIETTWQLQKLQVNLSYWSSGDVVQVAQGDTGAQVGVSCKCFNTKLNEFEVQAESHRASEKKPRGENRPF